MQIYAIPIFVHNIECLRSIPEEEKGESVMSAQTMGQIVIF
jgi:hypothetical protein